MIDHPTSVLNDVDIFDSQVSDLEAFFVDIARTNAKLVNQLHLTQKKINEDEFVGDLEVEKVKLKERVDALLEEKQELSRSNKDLYSTISELEQRVVELMEIARSRDNDRRSPTRHMNVDSTVLKNKLQILESKVQTLQDEKEDLEIKLEEMQEKISEMMRKQHTDDNEEGSIGGAMLLDNDSVRELKRQYEEREKKIRGELRAYMKVELQSRMLEAEDNLQAKMDEVEQNGKELKRREEKVALIEQQLEMLEKSNIDLRKEISRKNEEVQIMESKLSDSRDEVQRLKSENNSLEMSNRSLKADVQAHEAIATSRKSFSNPNSKESLALQRTVKNLQARLDLMTTQYELLLEENAKIALQGATSKEVTKKDMLSSYSQTKRLELEIQILKAENEQNGKDWLNQADLIEELTMKIDSHESKLSKLDQENRTLQLQKTDLTNRYDSLQKQFGGGVEYEE